MNKKRIGVTLAGLTIGLIGPLSVVTQTQAVADSPWDIPPRDGGGACLVNDVLSAPAGVSVIAGGKDPSDSPWD